MGCGTCEAVCPQGAVRVELSASRGIYLPIVNSDSCNGCRACVRVCPGDDVEIDRLSGLFTTGERRHAWLGSYVRLSVGYSTDQELRRRGSSGGLVTTLLIFALDAGLIDGAIVLGTDSGNPLRTRPFVARSESEILSAIGSKYCPGPSGRLLAEVLETPGRYAFVGLPCHVHALRKWQESNPLLKQRIAYVLGLFCANNNTYHGTEAFLRANRIDSSEVTAIRYRGEGWPGMIVVETPDGQLAFRRSTTETDPARVQLLSSCFHRDFMIPRCMVCCDQTAELADASFADPHLPEFRETERVGLSWWITRNDRADRLINDALVAGVVGCEAFPEEKALRAQNYSFKNDVGKRFALWVRLGRRVPSYDRPIGFRPRDAWRGARYAWSLLTHFRVVRLLIPVVVRIRHLLGLLARHGRRTTAFVRRMLGRVKSRLRRLKEARRR